MKQLTSLEDNHHKGMKNQDSFLKERFRLLGIPYTEPPKPGGSYVSVNVRGKIAYVAIQFPIKGEEFLFLGKLG